MQHSSKTFTLSSQQHLPLFERLLSLWFLLWFPLDAFLFLGIILNWHFPAWGRAAPLSVTAGALACILLGIQMISLGWLYYYYRRWLAGIHQVGAKLDRVGDGDVGIVFHEPRMGEDISRIAITLDRIFTKYLKHLTMIEEVRNRLNRNILVLRDNLVQLEMGTIIEEHSVQRGVEGMRHIQSVTDKIAGDIQSMLVSVGNTAYSVQVMERSIAKVDEDAQHMGNFVEKTSASIERMAVSIDDVSKKIENSSVLARRAAESADEGGRVVNDVINAISQISGSMNEFSNTMGELGKRSHEIGKITATIDDIADQTNLLALNAAIEASRAGEQGKGFAVVAAQIKKLAEKTSQATKEITRMIQSIQIDTGNAIESVEKGNHLVRQGVVMADRAGDSLSGIMETISQVSLLVNQINHSTQEQSRSSHQIRKSVATMKDLTGAVALATKQQYENSHLITQVVLDMQKVTNKVVGMLEEQDPATQRIHRSMEEVRDAARTMIQSTRSMEDLCRSLQEVLRVFDHVLSDFRL